MSCQPAHRCTLRTLLAILAILAAATYGHDTPDAPWMTGTDFQRQLDSRIDGITWTAGELRNKTRNLAETVRVAIWLDRRIDPCQELALQLTNLPLRGCLEQVASRVNAAVGTCGSVVYLGPRTTAAHIATLAALRNEDCLGLPPDARRRLLAPRPWSWKMLAEPRSLLAELAQEGQVAIDGLTDIPHDLWAEADLPPLTWPERLTLVLAGFDRTFQFDPTGRRVRLIPIPAEVTLTRRYPWRADPSLKLSELQQAVPAAKVQREGPQIRVVGRAEDHEIVSRRLFPRPPASSVAGKSKVVGPATQFFTMQGTAPLGNVLKTLEVRVQLRITVDPRVQGELYRRVAFDVKNARLEELLAAVFKDTGLAYELAGQELKVVPRENPPAPDG